MESEYGKVYRKEKEQIIESYNKDLNDFIRKSLKKRKEEKMIEKEKTFVLKSRSFDDRNIILLKSINKYILIVDFILGEPVIRCFSLNMQDPYLEFYHQCEEAEKGKKNEN